MRKQALRRSRPLALPYRPPVATPLPCSPDGSQLVARGSPPASSAALYDTAAPTRLRRVRELAGPLRGALWDGASGDLLLAELSGGGALVVSAVPAAALPLGRPLTRCVALAPPDAAFRGRAADLALGDRSAVLLSSRNRAYFFVTGGLLAELRAHATGSGEGSSKRSVQW